MGKVAIVAGGSQGLGREVARELLAQGYKVALFARKQAALAEAVADLGDGTLAVSVDISDEESVIRGFTKVDEELGPVDTLVNVAAVYEAFGIEDATAERIRPTIDINFCGTIYCMRQAVERMRKAGLGDIINVSSESVVRPTPFYSVYTASKAAVEAMTSLMSEELREDGIRCMIFRVGRMHTYGNTQVVFSDEMMKRYQDRKTLTGSAYWTGSGMDPASAAKVLVAQLATPRDARVELVQLRSA